MFPTLKHGEIVCIKKYNLDLKHNDIIVIRKNNKIIIKRLIGMPNDIIEIKDYVYVNEKKNDDLYTKDKGKVTNKICLKEEEYFVLGDNRQNSIDSRFDEIDIILKEEIIGKVIFRN